MKRLTTIAVLATALSGCGTTQDEEVDGRFDGVSGIVGTRVITDNETGCKYLFVKLANAGGLSPLYNENGEIDCRGSV